MKCCTKCNVSKPLSEFYGQFRSSDHLTYYCKSCINLEKNTYNVVNQDRIKIKNRAWYAQHRESELLKDKHSQQKRIVIDLNYKLKRSLRTRLHIAIKNNQKSGSAVKDLGCSIEFFKQYLESKFLPSMSWDNWGKVWQLDHIKELHTFDLTDRDQFLKACHYTNLQPLTIEEHQKKTIRATLIRRN